MAKGLEPRPKQYLYVVYDSDDRTANELFRSENHKEAEMAVERHEGKLYRYEVINGTAHSVGERL